MTGTQTVCIQCAKEFSITPDQAALYEKMQAPAPRECPDCSLRHRLAFWPFGKFHKRTCDLTGEKIISLYPAGTRFPVYQNSAWYSDTWTPPEATIDFHRPFFEQLYELQTKTPRPHQYGSNHEHCDYSDDVWN